MKGRNNTRAMKSSTVVIFEDPKDRVVSLLIEVHDDAAIIANMQSKIEFNVILYWYFRIAYKAMW